MTFATVNIEAYQARLSFPWTHSTVQQTVLFLSVAQLHNEIPVRARVVFYILNVQNAEKASFNKRKLQVLKYEA